MNLSPNARKWNYAGVLFILPALIVVLLLLVYPILSSFQYSFTNKHLIRPSYEYIGFDNYVKVLKNPEFYTSLFTSLKWTVLSIASQVVVGFMTALALNRIPKGKGMYRTLLIIPWAFPAIVIAFSWKWILNDIYGFLSHFLMSLNLIDQPIMFLSDPQLVFWTALGINLWFGAPLMMVNILSALQTIPQDQYEAAHVDGASPFQSFWYITLRHVRGVIGLLVVLRTIWVFNNFELIYLLTGGGPGTSTQTLPIYAYRMGWGLKQIGTASAITVILLFILLAVCFLYFKLLDRWEKEDAH